MRLTIHHEVSPVSIQVNSVGSGDDTGLNPVDPVEARRFTVLRLDGIAGVCLQTGLAALVGAVVIAASLRDLKEATQVIVVITGVAASIAGCAGGATLRHDPDEIGLVESTRFKRRQTVWALITLVSVIYLGTVLALAVQLA